MDEDKGADGVRWPVRTWLLAAIGGLGGLLAWAVDHMGDGPRSGAAICFLISFPAVLAFTLTRVRAAWSVIFSLAAAGLLALTLYGNGGKISVSEGNEWRFVCALLAVAIAVPIFQTVRDEGRWHSPYPQLHRYAWTDAVIGLGALLFSGIVKVVLILWAELFELIGIDFFAVLFHADWFLAPAYGVVGAGAVSLLRDWSQAVSAMQRMVMAVLGVLAPLLGCALLLFLGALPIVGLDKLWDATAATTPLLLSGLLLALLLTNAVLADHDAEVARPPALRLGAMVLAAAMLPLAALAATATYLRVDQHGLMPDRIWAMIFVAFGLLYGLVYLGALVWKQQLWAEAIRRGNITLALLIAGVALLLATPLLDFEAVSTRNQAARLLSGQVAPDKFDYAALKFDLGKFGRHMLARLRTLRDHPNAAVIRAQAAYVDKFNSRWEIPRPGEPEKRRREVEARLAKLIIRPQGMAIPPQLRALFIENDGSFYGCDADGHCMLLFVQLFGDAQPEAVIFQQYCDGCDFNTEVYALRGKDWRRVEGTGSITTDPLRAKNNKAVFDAILAGRFELRPEVRQRIYVGGKEVALPGL